MPDEFTGDLSGSEFWGTDLRGATFWGTDLRNSTFRDAELTGATITHAMVVDVTIDAVVDRLVVNGVDVTDYVEAHDPWATLRRASQAGTVDDIRVGWAVLRDAWAAVISVVAELDEQVATARLDEQWSAVETVRHLVFVVDKWCLGPLLERPFASIAMSNSGSVDVPWPGVDRAASPTVAEVLEVWRHRTALVDDVVNGLTAADRERMVDVIENGRHPVGECLGAVLGELFWHLRYTHRDLGRLGVAVPDPAA